MKVRQTEMEVILEPENDEDREKLKSVVLAMMSAAKVNMTQEE